MTGPVLLLHPTTNEKAIINSKGRNLFILSKNNKDVLNDPNRISNCKPKDTF
jgi:hypothetical protein